MILKKKYLITFKDGWFYINEHKIDEEIIVPEGHEVLCTHVFDEEINFRYNNHVLFELKVPEDIDFNEIGLLDLLVTIVNTESNLNVEKAKLAMSAMEKIHGKFKINERGVITPEKEERDERGVLIYYLLLGFVEIKP